MTEIRHQSTTAFPIFLLMPFFLKRVIHSLVFVKEELKRFSCFEFELVMVDFTCHRSQHAR